MRILAILLFLCTSINLIGCSSMRGNVVPQTGPSMEQVYDGMGIQASKAANGNNSPQTEMDVAAIRKTVSAENKERRKGSATAQGNAFRKLPNPELTLYVYPHLAGNAEIPIPGYSTVFNVYDHDHYALPQETARDK